MESRRSARAPRCRRARPAGQPPAFVAVHAQPVDMLLDPLVEPRQVLQVAMGSPHRRIAQNPQERGLLGVLVDDVGMICADIRLSGVNPAAATAPRAWRLALRHESDTAWGYSLKRPSVVGFLRQQGRGGKTIMVGSFVAVRGWALQPPRGARAKHGRSGARRGAFSMHGWR